EGDLEDLAVSGPIGLPVRSGVAVVDTVGPLIGKVWSGRGGRLAVDLVVGALDHARDLVPPLGREALRRVAHVGDERDTEDGTDQGQHEDDLEGVADGAPDATLGLAL